MASNGCHDFGAGWQVPRGRAPAERGSDCVWTVPPLSVGYATALEVGVYPCLAHPTPVAVSCLAQGYVRQVRFQSDF